jgi:two-component system, LytTR family, response regulator
MKEHVLISSLDRIDFLQEESIIYCKSEGRYTSFFSSDGRKFMACKNLGEYESILNSERFFRIHQSYIVNIKHILRIKKNEGIICVMDNGDELPISIRKQAAFYNYIGYK